MVTNKITGAEEGGRVDEGEGEGEEERVCVCVCVCLCACVCVRGVEKEKPIIRQLLLLCQHSTLLAAHRRTFFLYAFMSALYSCAASGFAGLDGFGSVSRD